MGDSCIRMLSGVFPQERSRLILDRDDPVGTAPVLILTSTVRPHPGVTVRVNDEQIRLGQYRHALRWWKSNSPWPIVFVDNSGSPLFEELNPEMNARCLLMAVEPPPAHLAARGKGVCEALMLRSAIERLDPRFNVIVKVTGRLTVTNIDRCLPPFDGRFVTCKMTPDLTFSDSRIFAGDRQSVNYLADCIIEKSNDEDVRYFEHELAAGALHLISQGVAFRSFRRLPSIRGISGTSGQSYGRGWQVPARLTYDGVRRFVHWRNLSL